MARLPLGGAFFSTPPLAVFDLFASAAETIQTPGAGLDQGSYLIALLQITLIDLILAGDNAVIIALAVHQLPPKQRVWGSLLGAGMAVGLRVVLTFLVAQMLNVPGLSLVGGLLIFGIALKLLQSNTGGEDHSKHGNATTLWQAVWLIIVADISMSLDNVLAVGGASHGDFGLLLFGLGLSIPLIVFTSNLLSWLMDHFPVIIWIGSAILGGVGLEMLIKDPLVLNQLKDTALVTVGAAHGEVAAPLHPAQWVAIWAHVIGAVVVVGVGLLMRRKKSGKVEAES